MVFPIFCRRKASLGRSLILVVGVLFYGLTLSLSILAGSLWRRTPARHCMIEVRITLVTLIVVDIALVYAVRLENAKMHCLDGQFNLKGSESIRPERETDFDSHNTASRLF